MYDDTKAYKQLKRLIRVGNVLLLVMVVESVVNMLRGDLLNTFLAVTGALIAHYALRYNQDRLERETQGRT